MAYIYETQTISSAGKMPSLSMLMGSSASSEIFNNVNANGFKSIFGREYDHMHQDFYRRHVEPMEALNFEVRRTVNMMMNPDQFRILDTIEDYESVPSCMELAILMYEPVYKGFMEGRIEGFGYDPNSLPQEDAFGRLLENFLCEDVGAVMDEAGYYPIEATLYSDDADLDDDELYAIRRTREFIRDQVLAKTDRDPTAIGLPRG